MKAWTLANRAMECGGVHDEPRYIQAGEAVLEMTVLLASGTTVTFVRCTRCAGPPPPDLTARAVGAAPLDNSALVQRAREVFAGIHRRHLLETIPLLVDREPGEEG